MYEAIVKHFAYRETLLPMLTQAFMSHFQPITANIDKMAKKGLQDTIKQMYAVFCNVSLVDI